MKNEENQYNGQSVIELIEKRSSIRTYKDVDLSDDIKEKLNEYFRSVKGPFDAKVRFMLIEKQLKDSSLKLGTYGVIKNAPAFIMAAVEKSSMYMEQLGYELEKVILYATSLNLGTCWLGGTFKKSEFAKAMNLKDNEALPIITPVGFPVDNGRMLDRIMRFVAGSKHRKDWNELFYDGNFAKGLSQSEALEYSIPLETLRLAPSASNKQPWRIVRGNGCFHFYLQHTKGYTNSLGFDIQKIDIGIAMCHFELSAQELGIEGAWVLKEAKIDAVPENTEYIISWEPKQ